MKAWTVTDIEPPGWECSTRSAARRSPAWPLSMALRLPTCRSRASRTFARPVPEALRGAAIRLAAGAVDIALAMGRREAQGQGGSAACRTHNKGSFEDLWQPGFHAAGRVRAARKAYAARHGHTLDDLKHAMAHVSCKSHENAVANRRRTCAIESASIRCWLHPWSPTRLGMYAAAA